MKKSEKSKKSIEKSEKSEKSNKQSVKKSKKSRTLFWSALPLNITSLIHNYQYNIFIEGNYNGL